MASPATGSPPYLGIPNATPPVGALRWLLPQPTPAWTETLDATEFAPACMQVGVSMPGEAPAQRSMRTVSTSTSGQPTRGLPVIVWIYGGGYTNGRPPMPLYAGDALAKGKASWS